MIVKHQLIQRLITQYTCYSQSIIMSYCQQYNVSKVPVSILVIRLNRLFRSEKSDFLNFFSADKNNTAQQFLDYISNLGEIIKLTEGDYTLPSVRSVQITDTLIVTVSSLVVNDKLFGTALRVRNRQPYHLKLENYIHFPSCDEMISYYTQNNLPWYNSNQAKGIKISEKGYFNCEAKQIIQDGAYYILEAFNKHHLVVYREEKWLSKVIDPSDIRRLLFYLKRKKGISDNYTIDYLTEEIGVLKLRQKIPSEEYALLCLIATPDKHINSTIFYFHKKELSAIKYILQEIIG